MHKAYLRPQYFKRATRDQFFKTIRVHLQNEEQSELIRKRL